MTTEIQTCYRHGDRRAGVRCQRCERPICPSCMVSASVGFHCPDCARAGRQKVLTARTLRSARPLVTMVLIGINVVVYLAGVSAEQSNAFAGRGGFLVDGGLCGPAVADGGFCDAGIPLLVEGGEWWRIVTSGFLHAGLLHLGFNMFALWWLGSQLESVLGRIGFFLLYTAGLTCGALGVIVVDSDALTVGASGAIFGLLGAALANQRARGVDIWASGLGGVLVVNLMFTFLVPGISIGGHLGGLAGGFLVGYLWFVVGPRVRNPAINYLGAAAITMVGFAGTLWAAHQGF